MTRGVQVVMSTHINSVLDALMSALIAVDIDTAWRFFDKTLGRGYGHDGNPGKMMLLAV